MSIEFQWDNGNLKHVIEDYPIRENTLLEVESLFLDNNFIAVPDRIDKFGEQQYHGVGTSKENRILYVVFVIRNDKIRPISCRPASQKERKKYYENL
jgi:uncharacterized DUF497 family protein